MSGHLDGYLEAAAMDAEAGVGGKLYATDFAPAAVEKAKKDYETFLAEAGDLLDGYDEETVAIDLWHTRTGAGAGFWDGDYGDVGDKLTELAKKLGHVDVYAGDDGMLHFYPG